MGKPKRVLVGTPTAEQKAYCLDAYLEGLKGLAGLGGWTGEWDVLVAENSRGNGYAKRLQAAVEEAGLKNVEVVRSGYAEKARERLVKARNKIRERVLEGGYEWLFFLDQDVVPPADALQRLMRHGKKIVAGTCLNRMTKEHVAVASFRWVDGSKEKVRLIPVEELFPSRLMEVAVVGMGATLIHKDVLEKVAFRFEPEKEAGEDVWFCRDALAAGYKAHLDSSVLCQHFFKTKFKASEW